MKERVDIGVVALITFTGDFRDRFGVMLKTRGYFVSGDSKKDPYFELEKRPTKEMIACIEEFARKLNGKAVFSLGKKKFIIVKDSEYEN